MVIKYQLLEPEWTGSWITHEADAWAKKSRMISKFSAADISLHRITAAPELFLSGDVLSSTASLRLSPNKPRLPFQVWHKRSDKRKRSGEEDSSENKKLLSYFCKALKISMLESQGWGEEDLGFFERLIHIHCADLKEPHCSSVKTPLTPYWPNGVTECTNWEMCEKMLEKQNYKTKEHPFTDLFSFWAPSVPR